jgi:D-xylose transport system substrate-binding protein
MSKRKFRRNVAACSILALPMLLAACGTNGNNTTSTSSSSNSSGGSSGSGSSGGKQIVGFLLPDTTSSARYETEDKPDFIADMKKLDPNAQVDYENAQGDATTQEQQAQAEIANGAKVLVIDPVDSQAAATIVTQADKAGVKVISYDRMIDGPVDYYVSFNNIEVGKLQAQYIADHTPAGGTVVMINGAQTDNNALQFKQGAMDVLEPLVKAGKLKIGYSTMTPNWDPANALREMEQALTSLNNNVNSVLAANDGLAGAVIQALSAQHLAGKVPVTGQDATNAGLHDIMLGTQGMTIYKPVPKEAEAAAEITAALLEGTTPPSSLINGTTTYDGKNIPSVLLQPEVVTKSNIQSTVIKDGYTTTAKINNPSAAN